MTTVREFLNQADAALALSRLEAAGIKGILADQISLSVSGAGTPAIPIRLQVADEEAERAGRILKGEEGVEALPDDFVPPAPPPQTEADKPVKRSGKGAMAAFVGGGICAVVVLGVVILFAHVNFGYVLLIFVGGGLAGILVRAYYRGDASGSARYSQRTKL